AAVSNVSGAATSSVRVIRARSAFSSTPGSSHALITSTAVLSTLATAPAIIPQHASPDRLRNVKRANELLHALGRLDSELLTEQSSAETELADRLADIALCEVDAHDGAMRALAQGLAGDGGKARVERVAEAIRGGEPFAERVERTEPQLSVALALDQDPVLVPVGQEIGAERRGVEVERAVVRAVERTAGRRLRVPQVDLHAGAERKRVALGLDEPMTVAVEPPERGAQAGVGTFLGRVEPERPRDVRPLQRALVERHEGEHALGAHRQADGLAVADEPERAEQGQPGGGHGQGDA